MEIEGSHDLSFAYFEPKKSNIESVISYYLMLIARSSYENKRAGYLFLTKVLESFVAGFSKQALEGVYRLHRLEEYVLEQLNDYVENLLRKTGDDKKRKQIQKAFESCRMDIEDELVSKRLTIVSSLMRQHNIHMMGSALSIRDKVFIEMVYFALNSKIRKHFPKFKLDKGVVASILKGEL